MRNLSSAASLAALLLLIPPAKAEEEAPIEASPSSNWFADFKDDTCAIRREFESAEHRFQIGLERRSISTSGALFVIAENLRAQKRKPRVFSKTSGFDLSSDNYSRLENGDWSGASLPVSTEEFEGLRTQDSAPDVLVENTFRHRVQLRVSGWNQALKVLDQCLEQVWIAQGLDPEVQRNLSRRLSEPLSYNFMTPILRKFHTTARRGEFGMRLIVGPDGKVSQCSTLSGLENSEFEEYACNRTIENARFEPALDQDGNPVTSETIVSGFVSSIGG